MVEGMVVNLHFLLFPLREPFRQVLWYPVKFIRHFDQMRKAPLGIWS